MSLILFDAHSHSGEASDAISRTVVNGTSPEDWTEVLHWAQLRNHLIPAIGLHPWKVEHAPEDWRIQFTRLLDKVGAIGEIGLDWHRPYFDAECQEAAFRWQLEQAAERNLPVSIHCLKASDALLRIFKESIRPCRGVHLHAYSGSAEQVHQFAELGAYFSFHAGQFRAGAKKAPAAAQAVPADRILVETDTSDARKSTDSTSLLRKGYAILAELRSTSVEQLADQVASNFNIYFLND